MRRVHLKFMSAALLLIAAAPPAGAWQMRPRRMLSLPPVQKIYVGDMGADDEAERFRLLLEEQLLKNGFEVVADPDKADAVLTGALSVRVYDDKSEARAAVRLTTQEGDVLWAKDFGHKRFRVNPFSLQEPTRRRAEEVAESLRREMKRPARSSP